MRSYFNSNNDLNEKTEEEDISEKNLNHLKFQDIYDDFVQIGNWTSDIETDFNEVFNKFKLEKNIEFKLSEFSLDLFLNSIFHIKQINFSFLKNYFNNKEQKIVNNSINKILNALSKMNYPFKINICKILDISHLIEKEEKYDLISLICKKIKLYNEPIKNNINEDINHMKNIREKKDKKQEVQLLKIQEQLLKNFGEEITENNNNNNNNKEEDLEKKEKENLEEIKEKNNKEEQKEIIKDYKTFQEWLDYIIDDSVVTPKNKKKNKKNKKQNENENNKIIEIYDPIVDEFKQNILNDNNDKNNKIKPVFSKEFLKKISNNFFK